MNFISLVSHSLSSLAHAPLLFALIALSAPTLVHSQVRLEIVPITDGGSYIGGSTPLINNHGQIAGSQGNSIAIWQRKRATQYLYALNHHSPVRVSDTGSVTGLQGYWDYSSDPGSYVHEPPFVWIEASGYQYIPTEHLHSGAVGTWKIPADINNEDVVVGSSTLIREDENSVVKAWIWNRENGTTEIPSLDQSYGYEYTQPRAVNDHGVVVGDYAFDFSPNGSSFYRAFVYDEENGSRSLSTIDPSFFSHLHIEAHDINNNNVIAGTISGSSYFAFVYDLEKGSGTTFSGFGSGPMGPPDAVARSVNNLGIAVGTAADWERANPEDQQNAPFLWSPKTGIARLTDFTTVPFENLLPTEANIEYVNYEVSGINDHGQISGSIFYLAGSPASGNLIPFVLYPTLSYNFELKELMSRPEGNLLVFSHSKELDEPSLSPQHFGKRILFESSVDAETWLPLEDGVNGVEIVDQEEELQIRLPEQPNILIRSRMIDDID